MRIILEKELEDWWGIENDMTNEDVINLLHEDMVALLDNMTWTIVRD